MPRVERDEPCPICGETAEYGLHFPTDPDGVPPASMEVDVSEDIETVCRDILGNVYLHTR